MCMISLKVNGKTYEVDAPPVRRLPIRPEELKQV